MHELLGHSLSRTSGLAVIGTGGNDRPLEEKVGRLVGVVHHGGSGGVRGNIPQRRTTRHRRGNEAEEQRSWYINRWSAEMDMGRTRFHARRRRSSSTRTHGCDANGSIGLEPKWLRPEMIGLDGCKRGRLKQYELVS